ncbi:hypothetical protein B0H13DRAFT_1863905 [Mycena leptocephala]|nr:hypothetical protein B0H13DRAFT_1863905 [Mycena leptocephala]
MTVVAISCFGENGTYPILALPACKHLNADDSATIYEVVTHVWDNIGAKTVGPLWSCAADGDMTHRIAGYKFFLAQKLRPTSPIYGTLAGICTLLRSSAGIVLNNGRIINPTTIKVPGQTITSVQDLVFPDDPQDVPRAIGLMQAVIAVGKLDISLSTPDVCADMDALRLLAEVVSALLEPFINTGLSLTEQITSLSTFVHLSFKLFRISRLQFMSNQLYGDSQTMVKNAMFCLAKQQELDPTQPFCLFQLGDDPLERLFGKLRMLGAHNSAMNYSQAIDRLGHAADLQSALDSAS